MKEDEITARLRAAGRKDQFAVRNEFLFQLPAVPIKRLLSDERDAPILHLLLNIITITLPSAALLFWLPPSHLLGVVHVAINYALFLQRFMLTLHFTEHRRLFRKGLNALNYIIPGIIAPFFGVPSGMYRLHHCVMHHIGDNRQGRDYSSTEPYQRDSILHFLIYWAKHTMFALFYVPCQALLFQQWGLFLGCIVTELVYLSSIAWLLRVAYVPALYIFVVPFFVSSLGLMLGNWSQHVFIDPDNPWSDYSLTYNCINCPDNQKTYNDGYHIIHHLNSQLHWSELPSKFMSTLPQHAQHDALIFEGIGFFDIGVAVLSQRWGYLVQHLVPCNERQAGLTETELIDMLKRRVQPIPESQVTR